MSDTTATTDGATALTTVIVVDDQALVRNGLRTIIDAQPDLLTVGEAGDGVEAIGLVRQVHPDVVLMDIRMPRMDGLTAAAEICSDPSLADTRVMVVTTFDDDDNIFAALKAGVGGFVGKDAAPDTLAQSIRTLTAGVGLVFPDATRSLIADHTSNAMLTPTMAKSLERLSDRETEVFTLVAQGLTNEEISDALFIGKATVKTHINRCFSKLEVRDRAQMVILAYEAGIVSPGTAG